MNNCIHQWEDHEVFCSSVCTSCGALSRVDGVLRRRDESDQEYAEKRKIFIDKIKEAKAAGV